MNVLREEGGGGRWELAMWCLTLDGRRGARGGFGCDGGESATIWQWCQGPAPSAASSYPVRGLEYSVPTCFYNAPGACNYCLDRCRC